jgi:hypothetical protein
MLSRPESQRELHARIGREVAETTARVNASRDDIVQQITGTRRQIDESRELLARVTAVLSRGWPP